MKSRRSKTKTVLKTLELSNSHLVNIQKKNWSIVLNRVKVKCQCQGIFSRQTMGYLELQAPNMVGNHPPFLPFSFFDFCLSQHPPNQSSQRHSLQRLPVDPPCSLFQKPQVFTKGKLEARHKQQFHGASKLLILHKISFFNISNKICSK